jgi:hypothetical protein
MWVDDAGADGPAAAHTVEGVVTRRRRRLGLFDGAAGLVVAAEAMHLEREPPEAVADAQAELTARPEAGVARRASLLRVHAGVAAGGELAHEVDLDVDTLVAVQACVFVRAGPIRRGARCRVHGAWCLRGQRAGQRGLPGRRHERGGLERRRGRAGGRRWEQRRGRGRGGRRRRDGGLGNRRHGLGVRRQSGRSGRWRGRRLDRGLDGGLRGHGDGLRSGSAGERCDDSTDGDERETILRQLGDPSLLHFFGASPPT